jgi:hypothetical protein
MPNTYTSVRTLTPGSAHASPRDVVHVTILAEAYTAAQENEFYADCARLVDEVFLAPTAAFASLAPLLAVHAVHVASEAGSLPNAYDRGGSSGGKASGKAHRHEPKKTPHPPTKTTAFNLRREDGPLRTVAPPDSGRPEYAKARRVCNAAAPGCDHVMLLARDRWCVRL